jgi:hypothetical protein
MTDLLHRICWLDETAGGHPKPSQFPQLDSYTILPNNLYVIYYGPKPARCWPKGGFNPIAIIWKHSTNLYLVFFRPGPNGARTAWLEADPRSGLRGNVYCELPVHGWRHWRVSGYADGVWVQERMMLSPIQPPAPSTITPSTPWEVTYQGVDWEIHEIIPSLPVTVAGYNLPAYASQVSDPEDGEEFD